MRGWHLALCEIQAATYSSHYEVATHLANKFTPKGEWKVGSWVGLKCESQRRWFQYRWVQKCERVNVFTFLKNLTSQSLQLYPSLHSCSYCVWVDSSMVLNNRLKSQRECSSSPWTDVLPEISQKTNCE